MSKEEKARLYCAYSSRVPLDDRAMMVYDLELIDIDTRTRDFEGDEVPIESKPLEIEERQDEKLSVETMAEEQPYVNLIAGFGISLLCIYACYRYSSNKGKSNVA